MTYLMNGVVIVERIKDNDAPFYRPTLPPQECEGMHPVMLTLMKLCWAEEPSKRPSFDEVARSLKSINKGRSVNVFLAYFFVQTSTSVF